MDVPTIPTTYFLRNTLGNTIKRQNKLANKFSSTRNAIM